MFFLESSEKYFEKKEEEELEEAQAINPEKLAYILIGVSIFLNIIDITLDVVFSIFWGFSFTITLRQRPKGLTHMQRGMTCQRERIRVTPLGFCLRVIVN